MFKKKENHNIPKDYDKQIKDSKQAGGNISTALVGESNTSSIKNTSSLPKPNKNVVIFSLIAVSFILVGWFIFKALNNQLVINTVVCNDEIVDKYNEAALFKFRGETEVATKDNIALESLVAEIRGKQNYKSDPTCQTILLEDAISKDDYISAMDIYDSLVNLHSKRKYANSNLMGTSPVDTYNDIILLLPSADKIREEQDQEPKGGA